MFFLNKNRKNQLNAVFSWLSGVVKKDELILLKTPNKNSVFCFKFPLRYGEKPKRVLWNTKVKTFSFIVRIGCFKKEPLEENWRYVFQSPDIDVLENKNRNFNAPSLLFSLSDEERKEAVTIVRNSIIDSLENKINDNINILSPSPRFLLKGDVEVSLWVKGRLRGAVVTEGENLTFGLKKAAIGALQDYRFKPLSKEEMDDLRIEITLIHDLKIPFSQKSLTGPLFEEKGYLLDYSGGKGWLLPSIFNLRKLKDIGDLKNILVVEKLGITHKNFNFKKSKLYLFEVHDFIESDNKNETLLLRGPVPAKKETKIDKEAIILHARSAADWLCSIQEKDGNIPSIIDPFWGIKKQMDLTRLAFSAWTLAELNKIIKESRYSKSTAKAFSFLQKQTDKILYSGHSFGISNPELIFTYFGRLAISLDKPDEAKKALNRVLSNLDNLNYEPITISQIGCFLYDIRPYLNNDFFDLPRIEKTLSLFENYFVQNFNERGMLYLASWAGLGEFFFSKNKKFHQKIMTWLKKQQLPNGAFPESNKSNFPYTRGTGKIFEILTLDPKHNKIEIANSLDWLFSMQYNHENTYFVPKEIIPLTLGGFRHDYFNQEAWIDSAGHFLLGCSRLLKDGI